MRPLNDTHGDDDEPVVARKRSFTVFIKDVALFLAAPFVAIAYAIALPVVGARLLWTRLFNRARQ